MKLKFGKKCKHSNRKEINISLPVALKMVVLIRLAEIAAVDKRLFICSVAEINVAEISWD